METLLGQCQWPSLPPKFDQALREAVQFILSRFKPVGIIVAGTIVRGNPAPSSDLDIYVIHLEPFRQRVQKFFNGVPAEIFVNPPTAVKRYFVEEHAALRPITAHMLATGFVILNLDPIISDLRQQAVGWLAKSPEETSESLTFARYMAATMYEDALDVAEHDPATAQMLLSRAMVDMLHFCFRKAGQFYPRSKALLTMLNKIDPETAQLACPFFEQSDLTARLRLAEQIAERTIGVRGFFEWESIPDKVEVK